MQASAPTPSADDRSGLRFDAWRCLALLVLGVPLPAPLPVPQTQTDRVVVLERMRKCEYSCSHVLLLSVADCSAAEITELRQMGDAHAPAQGGPLVHEAHFAASLGARVGRRRRRDTLPPSGRLAFHGSSSTLNIAHPAVGHGLWAGTGVRRSASESSLTSPQTLHESPSQAEGGGVGGGRGGRVQRRPDVGSRWLKRLLHMSVFEGASMRDCHRLLGSVRELLRTHQSVPVRTRILLVTIIFRVIEITMHTAVSHESLHPIAESSHRHTRATCSSHRFARAPYLHTTCTSPALFRFPQCV